MKHEIDAEQLSSLVERLTDRILSQVDLRRSDCPLEPWNLLDESPDRMGCLPLGAAPESNSEARLAARVASMIDHTYLKPDATPRDIETLCEEAILYQFKSVCVNASFVSQASRLLQASPVRVCAVVGFPLGATLTSVKVFETRQVLDAGAREVDMVLAIGMLKAGHHRYVENDIAEVVRAASNNTVVKVILETCLLTDEEKRTACRLARNAGADFVKTSTGFSTGGATADDVRLMRTEVGSDLGVKASGGMRSLDDARRLIESGATRLGTSASVAIVTESQPSTASAY